MKPSACILLSMLALPTWAGAEPDEIQTDRPDFVESSSTVGKGRFQIETSVSYERDKNNDERTRTYSTPTLLRLGFADDWEFRFETDGFLNQKVDDRNSTDSTRDRGLSDYALGLKWHQNDGDEKANTASTAWLFHLDMPGGTDSFISTKVRPSVRYVAEWEFGDYSVGIMPGVIYDVNDAGDRFWGGILGAVLGKSFGPRARGFVEFGGQQLMRKQDGGSQITFDTGFVYLLTNLVQLDMIYTHALNRYTPDNNLSFGLSVKF